MKKVILVIVCIILSNCEIKPRKVEAQGVHPASTFEPQANTYYKEGIEYIVFTSYSPEGGIYVINHTKEKLEIELLKKQLSQNQ